MLFNFPFSVLRSPLILVFDHIVKHLLRLLQFIVQSQVPLAIVKENRYGSAFRRDY